MNIFQELWYTERYTAETANMDRFGNRYFEMKRLDAAQRAADARRFNKYEGEALARPFQAEPRSSIRERALTKTLERVRGSDLGAALEPPRSTALSPVDRDVLSQRSAQRIGAEQRLMRQLRQIREQDAAADAQERAFAKASPLQQSKMRDGWYRRSSQDRNAAIAGMLQRERRRTAPLTREAFGRAKAIAAARGISDPYVVVAADLQSKEQFEFDPCEEFRLTQKRRRETFFAKNLIISGGYPGARQSRSPC